MSVDIHNNDSKRTSFCITFTTGGEFPPAWEAALAAWHVKKCDQALVVREGGPEEEEHLHYHSVGTFKTSKASNIKSMCETLYKKHDVAYDKPSVVVKTTTDLIGMFHYLLKDQVDDQPVLLLGWKMSWIKEQCLSNLKKIPHKVLMKNKYVLKTSTATAVVMEYAKRKSLILTGKDSFATLVCEMARDGYQFEAVKLKWLYCQCMSLTGDDHAMRSLIMNELHFLD